MVAILYLFSSLLQRSLLLESRLCVSLTKHISSHKNEIFPSKSTFSRCHKWISRESTSANASQNIQFSHIVALCSRFPCLNASRILVKFRLKFSHLHLLLTKTFIVSLSESVFYDLLTISVINCFTIHLCLFLCRLLKLGSR